MKYIILIIFMLLSSVSKAEALTPTLLRSTVVQTHKISELCIIEHITKDFQTNYCKKFAIISSNMNAHTAKEIQEMLYEEYIKGSTSEDEIQYLQILIYRIQLNAVYIRNIK